LRRLSDRTATGAVPDGPTEEVMTSSVRRSEGAIL
jgi:hypothetical protein